MTGFLDRAIARQDQTRQGPKCSVWIVLARMDEPYREQVLAAIADHTLRSTVICEILKEDGIELRSEPLQRHRSGRCACPKT